MLVTDAVAAAMADLGADTVFGVEGSGNFHVTNALRARGARLIAARHECGAAGMADGWARISGRPGVLSLHQGPGLTNALTALTEAAKSRTPLLVLAADVSSAAVRSNFRIDVAAIAAAIGAVPARLHSPGLAVDDTVRAYLTAAQQRRTVILALPLDVQASECTWPGVRPGQPPAAAAPEQRRVAALAGVLRQASRPVFIAGRGARTTGARADLEALADACGALLATSAAAKGLFRGSPWDLDVSGGFASPLAAELISGADLVVGWGCSLNMWTLRHGALIGPDALLAQVDHDQPAIGGYRRAGLGVVGDVGQTARAALAALGPAASAGYRPAELAAIGRGFGCAGVTVRGAADLGPVRDWLTGPRSEPLDRRQGHGRARRLVAGGGIPRPLIATAAGPRLRSRSACLLRRSSSLRARRGRCAPSSTRPLQPGGRDARGGRSNRGHPGLVPSWLAG